LESGSLPPVVSQHVLPLLLCTDLELDSVASSSSSAPTAVCRARCAYSEFLTRSLASLEGDDEQHGMSAAAEDSRATESAFALRRAGDSSASSLPSSSMNRRSLHALLLDRLFVARCIPEFCARLVIDALVRIDLSRHAFIVSSLTSSSSSNNLPAVGASIQPAPLRMALTDALLSRLSAHWRDAAFVAHASIAHHRHVAVSLLHALRRVCAAADNVDKVVAASVAIDSAAEASATAAAGGTASNVGAGASSGGAPLPRTPAQLADWASARAANANDDDNEAKNKKSKKATKRGGDHDDDAIDDADLALDPDSAPALSLSASYQRLLGAGVVGDMLEGVTLRLNSPLPAYRKLGMQVRARLRSFGLF
jgi:hypothetical protein